MIPYTTLSGSCSLPTCYHYLCTHIVSSTTLGISERTSQISTASHHCYLFLSLSVIYLPVVEQHIFNYIISFDSPLNPVGVAAITIVEGLEFRKVLCASPLPPL